MMSARRAVTFWAARQAAMVLPVLAVVACNPPESSLQARAASEAAAEPATHTGPTPSTALAEQPAFSWSALAPSVVLSKTPPAKLNLAGGYAFLLYPSTVVSVGDQSTFTFTASGGPGGLRVVLMRHCGAGSDGDSKSEEFEITSTPSEHTVTHTFAQAHPCLRVMFQSRDSAPNTFEIWNWKLTQPAQPATPTDTPLAPVSAIPSIAPAPAAPQIPATEQ